MVRQAEKEIMKPFEKCPICGDDLVEKEVDKLLRGGINTAVVHVSAEVCLRCGERYYSQETVRSFEQIRTKLKRQEAADLQLLSLRACSTSASSGCSGNNHLMATLASATTRVTIPATHRAPPGLPRR